MLPDCSILAQCSHLTSVWASGGASAGDKAGRMEQQLVAELWSHRPVGS